MPRVIYCYVESKKGDVELSVIVITHGENIRNIYRIVKLLGIQTFNNFELIVACECNGKKIAELLTRIKPGVRGLVLETGYFNRAKTANVAVRLAQGSYVVMLEDDLLFTPDFLEKLIKEFQIRKTTVPNLGVLACRGLDIYPRKSLAYHLEILRRVSFLVKVVRTLGDLPLLRAKEPIAFGTSFIALREVLCKVPYDHSLPEPMLGEDYDLAMRIRRKGYIIRFSESSVVLHITLGVIKRSYRFISNPKSAEFESLSNTYFFVRNADLLKYSVAGRVVYNLLFEPLNYLIRTRSFKVAYSTFKGALIGLCKGLKFLMRYRYKVVQ